MPEHVAQRLERPITRAEHSAAVATVVEECVDRLLQHALFVAQNDLGRAQFDQALEPVVAVDHATVQVIEVGGGVAPAFERHERPKIRRNDRDNIKHHPRRVIAGLAQ